MARTHKADRAYEFKLDEIAYKIRVLKAVGDVQSLEKHKPDEEDYKRAATAHKVAWEDVALQLMRL